MLLWTYLKHMDACGRVMCERWSFLFQISIDHTQGSGAAAPVEVVGRIERGRVCSFIIQRFSIRRLTPMLCCLCMGTGKRRDAWVESTAKPSWTLRIVLSFSLFDRCVMQAVLR